ncbi:hypothetical protein EW026_g5342 [Hermanssonia centrifuga]|uniref:ribonuclease Z n=1 Tax=Hermanssonia centrifuga TaxID=98765 RepID=A0A4S4KED3_9APHY|nr:hypothetical protein EW026_g5342 [Hermanssonia centrifuga]
MSAFVDPASSRFSADTRPTNNLVQAGKNATLLIHEATMGDEEEEMAQAKAHSTFSQAVDIGRRMKAENILLTHFSARYPKMPQSEVAISEDKVYSVLEDRASAPPADLSATEQSLLINDPSKPVLALAFDHARIRIGEMRKLRAYLPAIEQTFAETAEKEDEEINPKKGSW